MRKAAVLSLAVMALICVSLVQCQKFFFGRPNSPGFTCATDFGHFAHASDCSRYYVCIFGEPIEKTCSSPLVYSKQLETCDWPRNVRDCGSAGHVVDSQRRSPVVSASHLVHRLTAPPRARQVAPSIRQLSDAQLAPPAVSRQRATKHSADIISAGSRRQSRLEERQRTGSLLSTRARLLDAVNDRPVTAPQGFLEDTDRVVARRHQKLIQASPNGNYNGFQRVQQRIRWPSVKSRTPPSTHITLSSLSPFRSLSLSSFRAPSSTPPSTFIAAPSYSPTIPPRRPRITTSRRTVPTTTTQPPTTAPPPTTFRPTTPPPTSTAHPAYLAYYNDTIYDIYYVYDDDDVHYDDYDAEDVEDEEEVTSKPSLVSTTEGTTTTTSRAGRSTTDPYPTRSENDWLPSNGVSYREPVTPDGVSYRQPVTPDGVSYRQSTTPEATITQSTRRRPSTEKSIPNQTSRRQMVRRTTVQPTVTNPRRRPSSRRMVTVGSTNRSNRITTEPYSGGQAQEKTTEFSRQPSTSSIERVTVANTPRAKTVKQRQRATPTASTTPAASVSSKRIVWPKLSATRVRPTTSDDGFFFTAPETTLGVREFDTESYGVTDKVREKVEARSSSASVTPRRKKPSSEKSNLPRTTTVSSQSEIKESTHANLPGVSETTTWPSRNVPEATSSSTPSDASPSTDRSSDTTVTTSTDRITSSPTYRSPSTPVTIKEARRSKASITASRISRLFPTLSESYSSKNDSKTVSTPDKTKRPVKKHRPTLPTVKSTTAGRQRDRTTTPSTSSRKLKKPGRGGLVWPGSRPAHNRDRSHLSFRYNETELNEKVEAIRNRTGSYGKKNSPTTFGHTLDDGQRSLDVTAPVNRVSSLFPKKSSNLIEVNSSQKKGIWRNPPKRPEPVYPQTEAGSPAERCDARCKLPDCYCGGSATPGGLDFEQTPQLVLLTFDDAVNIGDEDLHEELFETGRTNPNGCPLQATFYVSHEWTDQTYLYSLYSRGHEVASHTISSTENYQGGLTKSSTPQLVLLTFDDSINDLNQPLYEEMFGEGRLNPNGCPIAATFYVSHEWTDYGQVRNMYADGHEIASHTISHSHGESFSEAKWEAEVVGQREILAAYGGIRMEDIRGMRAPFLSIGGNKMYNMLHRNNFTYDSSMPVYDIDPPSWPFTLDYHIRHECMIKPCPDRSYPGLWQIPMVMWKDMNGGRCNMVDACARPETAEEVYRMHLDNFNRHYNSNRAMFPLFFHSAWFNTPHQKQGFMAFLDHISAMDDVWLVTNWQAIQWMRNPQPLDSVKLFKPFQCQYPERLGRCNKPRRCKLPHNSGIRYMSTCQGCPSRYPWTGDTGIAKP